MNLIKIIHRIMTSVLLGTLVVVCICSCGKNTAYYMETEHENTETMWDNSIDTEESQYIDAQIEGEIYIYVCGAIQKPGVYTMPQGSRVCDVFEVAGGFTDVAAVDYWNQARVLSDGEMIYVPTILEASERDFRNLDFNKSTDDSNGKININTATKDELMTIPGIGEAKALAIISYREKNGAFSSIDEVKKVEGIKDGVFKKMKDYIEIN